MLYKWIPTTVMVKEEGNKKRNRKTLAFVKFRRKNLTFVMFWPKYGISACLAKISDLGAELGILARQGRSPNRNLSRRCLFWSINCNKWFGRFILSKLKLTTRI